MKKTNWVLMIPSIGPRRIYVNDDKVEHVRIKGEYTQIKGNYNLSGYPSEYLPFNRKKTLSNISTEGSDKQ